MVRKGGIPRDTMILDRERSRNAVNTAIQITEQQNSKLINKPNLKEAMTYWCNHIRAIVLKGQLSPHNLRYAFTQKAIAYYQSHGYSKKETFAQASMDLGHGDGRGRYIEQVYGCNENE
ncbi:integrase domain-containing protein [uncultured Gilliamella sp.]|uniref:integrase domain-containing protein n=1 Tax=uncultured Gilliamella sp. TaxID=1193505 RepID=UPI0025FF7E26|nr:integrase domain-containing protein [uncultured Gilliamella sp.]